MGPMQTEDERGRKRLRRLRMILLGLGVLVIVGAYLLYFVHVDCIWPATARAWIDENQNGRWDTGEKPLAGVTFYVDDVLNRPVKVGSDAVSGENGEANLSVFLPGCPPRRFEVYAEPPPGYELTTRARLIDFGSREFAFGFVRK